MKVFLIIAIALITLFITLGPIEVFPQTTEFSYQGSLNNGGSTTNGNFDFEFRLYGSASGGTLEGTNQRPNIAVTNGIFSAMLDFGAGAFPGADRYLEILVKPAGGGSFTTLAPRQRIGRTPYAISSGSADQAAFALNSQNAQSALNAQTAATATNATNATNAATAQNALQLGGVAANQYVQTNDARLSDERNPLPNNINYIQNRTTQQSATNFNISGNGTVGGTLSGNIVSAAMHYNIGSQRVLSSNAGSSNIFAGANAGAATTGSGNSFFGVSAGAFNTTGASNSFFGSSAGLSNTTGLGNSFFGVSAGRLNTAGNNNSFFGISSGNETTGSANSFFGRQSRRFNTSGVSNSYFGESAGSNNTTGNFNTFFGKDAGEANTTGSNNTIIGFNANVGADNLTNASAIGSRAFAELNNSLVLGSVNGKNGSTSDTNVGIGTTTPNTPLDIETQIIPTDIRADLRLTNFGRFSYISSRSSRGTRSGPTAITSDDILLLIGADGYNGSSFTNSAVASIYFVPTENWNPSGNGAAISFITTANGSTTPSTRMTINQDGRVGIGAGIVNSSPAQLLDVAGTIRVGPNSVNFGCIEDRDGTVIAGACSSDLRFKKDITSFGSILDNFAKLRPVNFFWRTDEFPDKRFGKSESFGLIAQEVEEIFPELVATDEQGFKLVNYSKLPLYTIQAVNQLKAENDTLMRRSLGQAELLILQQKQIEELNHKTAVLQGQISRQTETNRILESHLFALQTLICNSTTGADICKKKERSK
ncbi:MAG: tail fiber domain-containing protein [Pyrinomonadaceae bacterium]